MFLVWFQILSFLLLLRLKDLCHPTRTKDKAREFPAKSVGMKSERNESLLDQRGSNEVERDGVDYHTGPLLPAP
jgi:hypothetical protein